MATDFTINYEDEKFKQVEADKEMAITELNDTYGNMISQSDKFYQDQIAAAEDYGETQKMLQQQNSDFAIQQINQQKEQANKDYKREQSGAYVDWQKQSNQYGAGAEQMAAQGLAGTGYSESSQVGMYNTYQNRVATARETYSKVVLDYDNAIQEARLQNNAALAEIAYNTLQTRLQLLLDGFQYKNQLATEQLTMKQETEDRYYSRWQDVLEQMNTENAMEEEVRQFNESMSLQRDQLAEEIRQFEQNYSLQKQQFDEQIRQFNEELKRLKAKDSQEAKIQAEQIKLQKKELEQQQAQFKKEYSLKEKQLKEEKRQFDLSLEESKKNRSSSSRSSSVSSSNSAAVSTDFYSGSMNSDANKYGTFGNGYQPKGISGHGKLSAYKKGGQTVYINVTSKTLKGKTVKTEQKVWKADDGTLWYWYGAENKYKKFTGK